MIVSLRPAVEADRDFVRRLFFELRRAEFAPLGMPEATLDVLLDQQFHAQRAHYALAYPEAEDSIVVVDGADAGNLIVAELPSELRLVDITLEAEHRGHGVGTGLVEGVIARAREAGKPVILHVEVNNPARRLYDRLGFAEEEMVGIYWRMRWSPAETP